MRRFFFAFVRRRIGADVLRADTRNPPSYSKATWTRRTLLSGVLLLNYKLRNVLRLIAALAHFEGLACVAVVHVE